MLSCCRTLGTALMANAKYHVAKNADRWNVRYDGQDYPYESHGSAVLAAVKAAIRATEQGHEAEVLVQGVDGKWRTEWPDTKQGSRSRSFGQSSNLNLQSGAASILRPIKTASSGGLPAQVATGQSTA